MIEIELSALHSILLSYNKMCYINKTNNNNKKIIIHPSNSKNPPNPSSKASKAFVPSMAL